MQRQKKKKGFTWIVLAHGARLLMCEVEVSELSRIIVLLAEVCAVLQKVSLCRLVRARIFESEPGSSSQS